MWDEVDLSGLEWAEAGSGIGVELKLIGVNLECVEVCFGF